MAAPYNPPVKGEDFVVFISLQSRASLGDVLDNPPIAVGDFKVSKDGGAFANLTTLPTVEPALGPAVKVTLSATEMNADNVFVIARDQTVPKAWIDYTLDIVTIA